MLKFWKKALLVNLAVILAIVASLAIFFATPWGRPALKTMLLVPEVVPNFPVKPLKLFSKKPKIEEVSLKVDGREVKANLYRLPDNKKHPAVVFILGILYSKDNPNVTSTAEILSRSGFVVLVPDLPDFQSGFVWIDSVNTLISSVEFLDKQNFVDQKKIGFAGFCVGASAAIIAAEDERIANKVNFIAAISPYFDLYSTVDAIRGRQIIDDDGSLQSWEPAGLTIETFYKGFINYIADEKERALLTRYFLEEDTDFRITVGELSEEAQDIYEFLINKDSQKLKESWSFIPQGGKELLTLLSPSTKIKQLKAKLFVLNDKKDTFVPRGEGERLAKALPKDQISFTEVDSFEHVNPATRLERWAAIKGLFQHGRYLYNVLSEVS